MEFLAEQMKGAGPLRYRKMFGEYTVYLGDTIVALVADDRLFLKPTEPGRLLLPDAQEASPYPGAKPYLVVPEDEWDDAERMQSLVRATAAALRNPTPKPKPRSARKRRTT